LLDIQVKRYREVVKAATNLQQQAVMLKGVLEKRPDVLKILAWFESNTVDTVYYETFSVSDSGDVNIHVIAPSAVEASYQMNIFDSTKAWNKVTLSAISFGKKGDNALSVGFGAQFIGFQTEQPK